MNRRRVGILAAAVLAAVVVWVLWPRDDAEVAPGSAPATEAAPPVDTATASAFTSTPREPSLEGLPTVARLRRELEDYRKASIYPHWSMPVRADDAFVLDWNAAVNEDLQVEEDLVVRFSGDRGRVFAGEPYTSSIEAWRVDADGRRTPIPIAIERAAVSVTSGPTQGDAFELSYRDDGNLRYTNTFVPSEHDELSRATQTRIELYAEIAGNRRVFVRDFVYAPRDVLEVVGARDELRDGSLVVTLDVEAHEAGRYTFYGILKDAGGAPIAMSKLSYTLAAGRGTAELVFFGKVIRDTGLDGPYRVTDLHGLKRPEADEGDLWWSHRPEHRTKAYRHDQFSNAEWDDDERREKIAHFERAIRELEDAER